MMGSRSADAVLNESFLDVRARLLEIAATLDRIDRSVASGETLQGDSLARRQRLEQAISLLLEVDAAVDIASGQQQGPRAGAAPGRVEKLQRLFSREYQPDWRTTMNL